VVVGDVDHLTKEVVVSKIYQSPFVLECKTILNKYGYEQQEGYDIECYLDEGGGYVWVEGGNNPSWSIWDSEGATQDSSAPFERGTTAESLELLLKQILNN
jgi:hypothetical protein